MTRRLPAVSGARLVRALERVGWRVDRTRGSHALLEHPEHDRPLIIPLHRELKRGTLGGILRDARLSPDELRKLL